MTITQQLATDLDAAVSDAQLLVRHQLTTSLIYLRDAQRFEICEIRALLSELLAELDLPTHVDNYHASMRAGIKLVN